MKLYLLLVALYAVTMVCTAQAPPPNEFHLTGKVAGAPGKVLYLLYADETGKGQRDSCSLTDGSFTFRGRIGEPTIAVLKLGAEIIADATNKNITQFFLEPTKMMANIEYDKFADMVMTGSATQDEFGKLNKQHAYINKTYSDSLYERHAKLTEDHILAHSNSYVSAYQLAGYRGRWAQATLQYLYTRLTPPIRESKYGKEVINYLDDMKANAEGRPAKAFDAPTVQGKQLRLSDLKGRYVLLDFWGSWCVPCRASNPHLIELYKKYSAKGFEIVGIATEYDKTDAAWRAAIQKDGIDLWHNLLSEPISPTQGERTKGISNQYSVHVFPTKILIDPCGYIIGRFNGGDNDGRLDQLLKTIYQ